jgi:hypothetical protein
VREPAAYNGEQLLKRFRMHSAIRGAVPRKNQSFWGVGVGLVRSFEENFPSPIWRQWTLAPIPEQCSKRS